MTSAPTPQPSPAADPGGASLNLRVRNTEDLLAVAPLVLGFHPTDSVMMLTSDGDRPFHARSDLPARSAPSALVEALVDDIVRGARINGARSPAFLFFSADEPAVRRVWAALRRRCRHAGLRVVAAVRADGRRYFPLLGGGHLREVGVPYDVSAHPFLAQAVLRGIVIEKDRAAVVARVAPDPEAQRAVADAAQAAGLAATPPPGTGADRRRWGEWVQQSLRRHLDHGSAATDEEVARIAWSVQDVRVRDAAWVLIRRADAHRHRDFWCDVVRRVPEPLVPAPAALLGWAAWQSGHGALAWIAVDRCREVDPDYSMVGLLAGCLQRAVPPDRLDDPLPWDEGLPA